ncbi:MAG: AAA family ATPase, partial [Bacteroides sp.]
MTERKLPIGVQSFQSLRESGYLYVDKTQYIEQLLRGKVYFLSRPRRFGKSLFLSTLAAYFRGAKELFEGLYLAQAEEELARQSKREAWQKHPVLYLDLNAKNFDTKQALIDTLERHLLNWEQEYNLAQRFDAPEDRFYDIIEQLYRSTGTRVVVLVDEYDKPLLQTLEKEQSELHETFRRILAGFYSVLKSCDQYIQFVFLTGVTKFSKLSVFSGLNNLNDISLDDAYAGLCGITDAELRSTFTPELQALGEKLSLSTEATLALLKKKYDGYRFAIEGENVYNPFNLLKVFQKLSLGYYWFATGTPTFLAKKLQELCYPLPD